MSNSNDDSSTGSAGDDNSTGSTSDDSNVLFVVVGTTGMLVATLSILMVGAVIAVCVKRKHNMTHHSIEMAENEVTKRTKKDTTCNEAYGTAATEDHNTIPPLENQAYATSGDFEPNSDIITSQNKAYGISATNQYSVLHDHEYDYVQ